jgi:pSer/pThr/pTyr-binding forkhead associated (FHA) protein
MFDFATSREVLVGRGPACSLIYDENFDETVSREHAKIVQDARDANVFMIENLSRNGTFVDGQRIATPAPLAHGSVVKFGMSGPSFVFEIDPPPASSGPKATLFDFGDGQTPVPKVLVKHQSGSKAPRTENLDFTRSGQILIGRDPACALVYDEDVDKTVSREHAKIVRSSGDPSVFIIENLSRSNGTFVNGRRIGSPVPLSHGSTVKFGPSGPSFIFEIDPPPPAKPTVADFGEPTGEKGAGPAEPWWVRMQTLSDSTPNSDGHWHPARIALMFAVVLLVSVVGVGAFLFFTRPLGSDAILQANGPAVVSIDATWRLFDPESGRQAYHWYVQGPVMGNATESLGEARRPVFVRMQDGGIEPVLILDDERDTNRAIGGRALGSGCVVHENGFILTSSLVAAEFNTQYSWPSGTSPALLIDQGTHSVSTLNELPGWVPSSARFVITRRTTVEDVRQGRVEPTGHHLEGRLDAISVGFSGSESRITAKLVGMSANNRLALLKADPLHPLHSVTINGDTTRLAVAEPTFLIGYSGSQKKVAIRMASVIKVAEAVAGKAGLPCSGCYLISDGGADAGFRGGPAFDDHGRLAGVFLPQGGRQEKIFAIVPVEQAADLLGLSQK